jgi:hypothetical protein
MLQAGRSGVRFPIRSLNSSNYLILPAALWPWSRPGLLIEMNTGNLPGDKERPARKADKFTAIYELIVY